MLVIEALGRPTVGEQDIEIVERKGIGHPDTICDSVMEAICLALYREYVSEFGTVLHYNVDKGLLAAGAVEKSFGGGRVTRPMRLFIGDRATSSVGAREIAVGDIAVEAAREWFRTHLRHVDPERHLDCQLALAPGSEQLRDLFRDTRQVHPANDTSVGIGHHPLTATERLVLGLEEYLNGESFKTAFPDSGEDVKVMAMRHAAGTTVTVAMPLMANRIRSESDYFERKDAILRDLYRWLGEHAPSADARLELNALDRRGAGAAGVYLSLLGTSAEDADSGQVGRGNRVNGLITFNRPMSLEAAAGKNPVSHVGKIYNVLAQELARDIHDRIAAVREAGVVLLSRIGARIDQPQATTVRLAMENGTHLDDVRDAVAAIVAERLADIAAFCVELGQGRFRVC